MNRSVFNVGVLIFIVGIALFSASLIINPYFHGNSSNIYFTFNYTKEENGLYVTSLPVNLTGQEFDIMFIPNTSLNRLPSQFALIPQSDISGINASNYNHFNVAEPTNNTADIYYNNVPKGAYALVEPKNDFIAFTVTPTVPLDIAGYMSFSGGAAAFVGFIVVIVSLFLRRKDPPIEF